MTDAPKKKRGGPAGPRTAKPIYAVASYTDEDGTSHKLSKAGLTITLVRDANTIVEMLEGGAGEATILRVQLPEGPKRVGKGEDTSAA